METTDMALVAYGYKITNFVMGFILVFVMNFCGYPPALFTDIIY
jgi:hypothetical protein